MPRHNHRAFVIGRKSSHGTARWGHDPDGCGRRLSKSRSVAGPRRHACSGRLPILRSLAEVAPAKAPNAGARGARRQSVSSRPMRPCSEVGARSLLPAKCGSLPQRWVGVASGTACAARPPHSRPMRRTTRGTGNRRIRKHTPGAVGRVRRDAAAANGSSLRHS
jgi:hypothetical protein